VPSGRADSPTRTSSLSFIAGGVGVDTVADWRDAVVPAPGGILLLLEVAAGARDNRFPDGFNPWRDGRIGIRVAAPAQDGRANLEVIRTLAAFFQHPTARIHIEAGQTDSRKAVRIMGLDVAAAVARISSAMEEKK
jgi:uncharacterized protein (TIGR00251 family)